MLKDYKAPLASYSYPFVMVSGQALHIILSHHGEACAQTAKGVNRFTPNNRAMGLTNNDANILIYLQALPFSVLGKAKLFNGG